MSEQQPQGQDHGPTAEHEAERQRQVEELADQYLERLLAGELVDQQRFLAEHEALADLLRPRLELLELMHRVARGQHPATGETASAAPPGVPAERALHVKCPHCGNCIQLVEPESAEVTCTGCGSSFHVEPGATTTFHSAALPRSIGRFEVLAQLGRGAFGTVYKARDPELQRLVAVKVPRAGSFATSEEEERFLREARAAAQLSHPGIVPVLEIAHDRGMPFIVSEYIEGLTLADVLTGRRPGFHEAAELIAAAADALDYAHRCHIVHRDVKPSNLLLDAAGRPHLTDFGLARRGEGEITVTLDGQILGTPAYMSPEQAAGDQQRVDARSDVYSLGVMLYELLSGELPFRGNQRMLLHQVLHDEPRPPRSLNDRVPRDLETICLKAMAKTPGQRYGSALELADDLRRFLNGDTIRARRVGRPEKLARWARRNPLVATLTTAVAVLLLAATAAAISFAVYQRQANRELADKNDQVEQSRREAEVRAASAAVDLDLKHCEDGEIEYGVLRLARTLGDLPPHATELRQCVEMNLLAWAQEIRPLGPTFQYDGAETKWELSPDGLTVLSGGADGTARLWDAFTGEVRATLQGHRGEITGLAFSQNGRVAITIGEDQTMRSWEVRNGQVRGVTAEHPKIERVLLSPDARRLLTIYYERPGTWWGDPAAVKNKATVVLWDTAADKRIGALTGHEGQVNDAAFSPDGQLVLTGGADKTARLWSADSGRPLTTLKGHAGMVVRVAISPDGAVLATLDTTGCVRWWDSEKYQQIMPPCISPPIPSAKPLGFRFIQSDVVVFEGCPGMGNFGGQCYIRGLESSIEFPGCELTKCRADDDCVVDSQGRVYDRKSRKRRQAPAGREFDTELARFATNGRFFVLNLLVDLHNEKYIGRRPVQYVPERQSFVSLIRASPRKGPGSAAYVIPLPSEALDAELAKLFAEVVTCHELDLGATTRALDETAWDERRRGLASRLEKHSAPLCLRQVSVDKGYWLRRQAEQAKTHDDVIKWLDRLIAAEPTWQNYDWRGSVHLTTHPVEAARDYLEAGRRAGEGYWYRVRWDAYNLVCQLSLPQMNSPKEYNVGLQLAEACSHARPELRIWVAVALYRLGRYAEALANLQSRRGEWERYVISQVGQFFLMGPRALLVRSEFPLFGDDAFLGVKEMAFLAMAHYRLGHKDSAQEVLNDLRAFGELPTQTHTGAIETVRQLDGFELVREAETLIEGRPRPDK